jgi:hypothetical protein
MSTIIAVSKQELDKMPGLLAQLQAIVEQMSTMEDEYTFLPLPDYEQSFIKMLESNQISHYTPDLDVQ